MNEINKQHVVNGNFATGDLEGWNVVDPAQYKVVEYETGKHCVVQLLAQHGEALDQSFTVRPGTYQVYFRHRVTDGTGQPVDGPTIHTANVKYRTSSGTEYGSSMILVSRGDWRKSVYEFTVHAVDPEAVVKMTFWNAVVDLPEGLDQDLYEKNTRSPVALTDIGFWKVG